MTVLKIIPCEAFKYKCRGGVGAFKTKETNR